MYYFFKQIKILQWIKLKFISKDSWIVRSFELVCLWILCLWPHWPVTTNTVATPFALQIVAWKVPYSKYIQSFWVFMSEQDRSLGFLILSPHCFFCSASLLVPFTFNPTLSIPIFHDPTTTLMSSHHSWLLLCYLHSSPLVMSASLLLGAKAQIICLLLVLKTSITSWD